MRQAGVGAVLRAAAASVISQTVRAHKFVLVDSRGDIRAEPGVAREHTCLAFYDQSGVSRAVLAVEPGGIVGLGLSEASGVTRATLGLEADGRPSLELADAKGNPCAAFSFDPAGHPGIALPDPCGQQPAGFA